MKKLNPQMLIAKNEQFGPPSVVQIKKVDLPKIFKKEILVRSNASTVTVADHRLRSKNVPRGFGFIMGLLFGFKTPKYNSLGTCVAGEVVAIGTDTHLFKVGDRILANLGMKLGGHAQYVKLLENGPVIQIPTSINDEDAAAIVFGGSTALIFLRDKLKVQKNDRLLIIGAGGSVGTAAIQIGKIFGAHVTAVCSTDKISYVKELGADAVIDYKKNDWRQGPETYDHILDMVGGTDISNARHKLNTQGKIGLVVADLPTNLKCAWISMFSKQKMIAGSIMETREELEQLLNWMVEGKLKSCIGQKFPFEKIVEAHQLVDQGNKLGNVVLQFPKNY